VRARLRSTVVLVAMLAALVASAIAVASPVIQVTPTLETILSGGPSPTRLPARERAPVSLLLAERVQAPDGSHPPALRHLEVDLDRHFALDVEGLPRCHPGLQEQRKTVVEQCEPAEVGAGTLAVEVAFPEQQPREVEGTLQVFNGGIVRGVTTFWLYAYLPAPVGGSITMQLRFRRHADGRYGLQGVLDGPRIADGAGSITYLGARFRKGIFSASCPDGELQEQATSLFATGASQRATLIHTCKTAASD
jgi:hypothetical protein